jgi:hypothetical protein
MEDCPLCAFKSSLLSQYRSTNFFNCPNCGSVFRDPDDNITPEQEKERYLAHNNSPTDPGYRNFVAPIIEEVEKHFTPKHTGLDFGAGPVPVIAEILKNKDYKVEIYDPFFHNRPQALKQTYDYITACEVIEHFREPVREFHLLRSLLKPNGALLCMTELWEPAIDFQSWPYKNDITHRFFYTRKALEWVREEFGFASLQIDGRLASFRAP